VISGLLRVNGDVGRIHTVTITSEGIALTADIAVTKWLQEPKPLFILTEDGDLVVESTDLIDAPAAPPDVIRATYVLRFDNLNVADGELPTVRS
jgi:hypothetical protein